MIFLKLLRNLETSYFIIPSTSFANTRALTKTPELSAILALIFNCFPQHYNVFSKVLLLEFFHPPSLGRMHPKQAFPHYKMHSSAPRLGKCILHEHCLAIRCIGLKWGSEIASYTGNVALKDASPRSKVTKTLNRATLASGPVSYLSIMSQRITYLRSRSFWLPRPFLHST